MAMFHPRFGELLTSRECADLTGFTINQLRNDRQKSDPVLPFVRQGGGSWYRRADVDLWLESSGGGADWEYVGSVKGAPLLNESATGEHKVVLEKLAKITSANAFSTWYTWFIEQSGWNGDAYGQAREWQTYFHKLVSGEDLDVLFPSLVSFNMMRSKDPLRYWGSIVWAMRKAVAVVNGWDVTDEEIISAPVGDVPPAKLV